MLDVAPYMFETRNSWLDRAAAGATVGVAAWVVARVILLPLLTAHGAQWSDVGLRSAFPALVGWMFLGFVLGAIANAVIASGRLPRRRSGATAPVRARIVIIGGGFAGHSTASALERTYALDRSVEITLVSDTNALLFTPMLAEVAGGSLEPAHIGSPLRTALRARRSCAGASRRSTSSGAPSSSATALCPTIISSSLSARSPATSG